MSALIAIVGRPNVGKSTLLNRLARRQAAVVEDVPGVTRDRLFVDAELGGRRVILVDTGGFDTQADDALTRETVEQARLAVEEADFVLFLCDAEVGFHPMDQEVADILRRCRKPILCVANKCDPGCHTRAPDEFHRLGFDVVALSALHNHGLDELHAWAAAHLPPIPAEPQPDAGQTHELKLCLLGRPNVGKSSLANRLAGKQRQIVSPIPGTTRDAVDIPIEWRGAHFLLVDTPGVRRKSKVTGKLEHLSVVAALRTLERADVAVVVLDGSEPYSDQDARLLNLVDERGRGLIVAVNKADTWSPDERKTYLTDLTYGVRHVDYAPVLALSARTGEGVQKLLPAVRKAFGQSGLRIGTGELNRFVADALEHKQPPVIKGRRAKIYYLTQASVRPPTFVAWVNDPARLHLSYRRYLENRLRAKYGFQGTAVRWFYRSKSGGEEDSGRKEPAR
ncbi:MAG TPA: ribosome biogenesis GTPase Der [Myxococcota bacterium]|nr:ribosome biogenesis GTPase Der [Myxococcota bacterium]HRY94046.1 ribosome biogenesis GTPase Der [Myxococcota bacterium]HSA21970.1 ribosome biogenesis GTPase Der [Myxococcota bacterium]